MVTPLTANGTGHMQEVVTKQGKNGAYNIGKVAFLGLTQEFFLTDEMAAKCRPLEGKLVTVECEVQAKGYDSKVVLRDVHEAQVPRAKMAA